MTLSPGLIRGKYLLGHEHLVPVTVSVPFLDEVAQAVMHAVFVLRYLRKLAVKSVNKPGVRQGNLRFRFQGVVQLDARVQRVAWS
jgi:hypothetical protein